ncbi:hypothetical protein MBANPS3_007606 [Mucor bainieri]
MRYCSTLIYLVAICLLAVSVCAAPQANINGEDVFIGTPGMDGNGRFTTDDVYQNAGGPRDGNVICNGITFSENSLESIIQQVLYSFRVATNLFTDAAIQQFRALDKKTQGDIVAKALRTIQEFWCNLCMNAFRDNTLANDFILFFDSCKTPMPDGRYSWKTSDPDYQYNLQQLGCALLDNDTFTLPVETVNMFINEKRKTRSKWHEERQMELRQHLQQTLKNVSTSPLDLNDDQKMALVREFMSIHATDLGSVPFLKRLAGFLQYQIQHKHNVVEWRMSEFILTQNDEEPMESYIRLLRGVLGMQLVYQDDDNEHNNGTVAIDMQSSARKTATDPELIWRMSPDIDIRLLQNILKHMPKQAQTSTTLDDYIVTDIPRTASHEHRNILQWILDILGHCLSFLHK